MIDTIQLHNDFHGTVARIRIGWGQPLSPSQVARARRTLCGIATCQCGGTLGERPTDQGAGVYVSYDHLGRPIILAD